MCQKSNPWQFPLLPIVPIQRLLSPFIQLLKPKTYASSVINFSFLPPHPVLYKIWLILQLTKVVLKLVYFFPFLPPSLLSKQPSFLTSSTATILIAVLESSLSDLPHGFIFHTTARMIDHIWKSLTHIRHAVNSSNLSFLPLVAILDWTLDTYIWYYLLWCLASDGGEFCVMLRPNSEVFTSISMLMKVSHMNLGWGEKTLENSFLTILISSQSYFFFWNNFL